MNIFSRGKPFDTIGNDVIHVAVAVALVCFVPAHLRAEDRGARDSVILEIRSDGNVHPQDFIVDLFVFNDSDNLASVSVNFGWDNKSIRMDSAVATTLAETSFDLNRVIIPSSPLFLPPDIANKNFILSFVGARFLAEGLPQSQDRKLLGSCYFSVLSWSSPDCICFDTATIGPYSSARFVNASNQGFTPFWSGPVCLFSGEDSDSDGVGNACRFCCIGMSGNIDCDPGEIVDVSDLTSLIDHLFLSLSPLCCKGEGDIDGDGSRDVSLADLTLLIDHLFIDRNPIADCR